MQCSSGTQVKIPERKEAVRKPVSSRIGLELNLLKEAEGEVRIVRSARHYNYEVIDNQTKRKYWRDTNSTNHVYRELDGVQVKVLVNGDYIYQMEYDNKIVFDYASCVRRLKYGIENGIVCFVLGITGTIIIYLRRQYKMRKTQ